MTRAISYFRTLPDRPMVRPWALAVPILVLVFACPILRPLRHPYPAEISRDEVTRLATVQAIVEHGTLDLESAGVRGGPYGIAADESAGVRQPPMLAMLLSPAYWVMRWLGLTMADNSAAVAYLLTLLGVTIPVAVAGGLIYRMGRFFELPRKWRTLLGFVAVFGTGLISYSTVLNAHAPAAVLVLAGCAAMIHTATHARSYSVWLFVTLAGLCLGLAATISPPAIIFVALMSFVVLAFRWRVKYRALGLVCYGLGALIPLAVHGWATGTVADYFLPAELRVAGMGTAGDTLLDPTLEMISSDEPATLGSLVMEDVGNMVSSVVGGHGLLSHFPVLIMGVLGIAAVMHRHWSVATKVFATATAGAAVVIMIGCVVWLSDWSEAMFATRWFVVFTPLLMYWAGAWMRRSHRPATWGLVGALALFSVTVSMIGATYPLPRDGYQGYSALSALRAMTVGEPMDSQTVVARGR